MKLTIHDLLEEAARLRRENHHLRVQLGMVRAAQRRKLNEDQARRITAALEAGAVPQQVADHLGIDLGDLFAAVSAVAK